jgi:hypothetical protein
MAEHDDTRALVRLEVKLDQLLTLNGDHETRIRALETRSTSTGAVTIPMASGLALISALGTALGLWAV